MKVSRRKKRSTKRSAVCFKLAKKYIPGGVNSPVRAFHAVGGIPIFISRAKGAYLYDVDGNSYIDYCMSWGPMILGHADKRVTSSVLAVVKKGTSFGAPTEREIGLARLITDIYPSIDKVRLTSSGTEAAMSVIRLARGYTKRKKIIKFEGCYHGHADSLLVKAGSGLATFGAPSSAGVTTGTASDTITIPFNDFEKVEEAVSREGKDAACIIVEPIPANMGVVIPKEGFLKNLRTITKKNGIVLIFDEVITGFRAALGGAQELYGITPDLTILGKVLGGGFPMGAFGGRGEIMSLLAPDGPVYQAGTLSGNPVAVEAGICTIRILMKDGVYDRINALSAVLEAGLKGAIDYHGIKAIVQRAGSLFTMFFTGKDELANYDDVSGCDIGRYARFFRGMLEAGVYFAPSQFEANFVSAKHSFADIRKTIEIADSVLSRM